MADTIDLLIRHARVVTCDGQGDTASARLGILDAGAIAIREGRIVWLGPDEDRPRHDVARELDVGGRVALPGLVDPHTHLVFAGSRVDEYARRMAGEDYRAIAAAGGGIVSTVRATRMASDEALFESASARALIMRSHGVTTVEVKSGYGLSTAHELRMLEVGRRLHSEGIVRTTTTLLGAHAVPLEHKEDRAGYVLEVLGEMIPRAAALGVADACDVYCDEGAFTLAETRAILVAAKEANLRVRAHVGQFADLGAAELIAELGGTSCDHLEEVSDAGLEAMARAGVCAVLLPAAWRSLRQTPPNAERLRRFGVRVALGTDLNPGTAPSMDLPLQAGLAVRDAGLTTEEAVLGVTRYAADACGLADAGRLARGLRADIALYDDEDPRCIGYWLGGLRAWKVLLEGREVE